MKKHVTHRLIATSLTGLALILGTSARLSGQAPMPQTSAGGQESPLTVEVATDQSVRYGISNLQGKPVKTENQEQLSTLADFLIDPQSGRLEYALVPSGAGPGGETHRLVPMAALDSSRAPEEFTVRVDRQQWDKVGTLAQARVQGRVQVDAAMQSRLREQFGLTAPAQPARGFDHLVRATQLKGRELRSGAESLGAIQDVVIDLHNLRAAPLIDPAANVAGVDKDFLIPFDRLQFGAATGQGPIATNVSPLELQQVQQGLSPTGYPGGQPPLQDPNVVAQAVRQTLQQNPAASGVQVVPATTLILRGAVESDQRKMEIEAAARMAAPPDTRIESQLEVRK